MELDIRLGYSNSDSRDPVSLGNPIEKKESQDHSGDYCGAMISSKYVRLEGQRVCKRLPLLAAVRIAHFIAKH